MNMVIIAVVGGLLGVVLGCALVPAGYALESLASAGSSSGNVAR
jgi:hypothetical protein